MNKIWGGGGITSHPTSELLLPRPGLGISTHITTQLLLCIGQYALTLHKNWNTVCNLHGKGSKLKSSEVEQKHSISQHQTLKASTSTQNGWPHRHTAKLTQAGPRGEKNHLEV